MDDDGASCVRGGGDCRTPRPGHKQRKGFRPDSSILLCAGMTRVFIFHLIPVQAQYVQSSVSLVRRRNVRLGSSLCQKN